MKLKSIVSSQCNRSTVALLTEPPLTTEVFKEAQKHIHPDVKLKLDFLEGTLLVKNVQYPPAKRMFDELSEILTKANLAVELQRKSELASHKSIVDQYSQVSGLPIHV